VGAPLESLYTDKGKKKSFSRRRLIGSGASDKKKDDEPNAKDSIRKLMLRRKRGTA